MKIFKNRNVWMGSLLVVLSLSFIVSCKYDVKELGPKPVASFTVTPVSGQVNKFLLSSNSQNAFRYEWDKGTGTYTAGSATDTAYFAEKGTYRIRLFVYGQSGIDTTSQVITVAADDPNGCSGARKMLTACSSKTWVLDPAAGALWVGDVNGGMWWSNGTGDVTAADRVCHFNDRYTFNANGTFTRDMRGDFRVDDENSAAWPTDIGLPIGCHNITALPAKYAAWGNSTGLTFRVVNNNQLELNGPGAYMGLYKAGETGTTAMPESTINYEIMSISDTRLVIRKLYSWGQWRFTFKPL